MADDSPPVGTLGLIDARRVFWHDAGAVLSMSTAGALEMTSPTGATDTPTGASGPDVSLFQAEAVALKVVRRAAWFAAADAAAHFVTSF